jgi:hypothetical protein
VLFVRSSKKSRILRYKKCKKIKKPTAVFKKKKKERQRHSAPPTPKKSKKSILIFAIFFFDFCVRLLDAVRQLERLIVQK